MESERMGQDVTLVDVLDGPLHADPEPEPDLKDPTTKGAAYRKILEEEPVDERDDDAVEPEPDHP